MDYTQARWRNATGDANGAPTFVRLNLSITEAEMAAYHFAVVVTLEFAAVGEDGLCEDHDELHLADEVERSIADAICGKGALFVMAVASAGTRDLFFYFRSSVEEAAIVADIATLSGPFESHVFVREDKLWKPYHMFQAWKNQVDPNQARTTR